MTQHLEDHAPTATDSVEAVIPASHLDLLAWTALAHVATIGPNGELPSNPVWFDWNGTHLCFAHTTSRQKYRNLRRDPRIAVSIVDPANPGRYLEIRGVARIEPDPDRAFPHRLAKKYLGLDRATWDLGDEEYVVIVVEPRHTSRMG